MKRYRTIIAYKNYFEDFLDLQTPKVQEKILQILRVIEYVEIIPKNHFKHIVGVDGLYEIRVIFGSNIFRIFCLFDDSKLVILLSGFQKKTSRIPKKEIDRATRIMREYYLEKKEKNI